MVCYHCGPLVLCFVVTPRHPPPPPPPIQSFGSYLDTLKLFLVDIISLTKANCSNPMNYYQSLVLVLVGFKAALLTVVLAPVVVHCARRARQAWTLRAQQKMSIEGLMSPRTRASLNFVAIFRTSFMLLFVAYVSAHALPRASFLGGGRVKVTVAWCVCWGVCVDGRRGGSGVRHVVRGHAPNHPPHTRLTPHASHDAGTPPCPCESSEPSNV
jgi:hypothetical protein